MKKLPVYLTCITLLLILLSTNAHAVNHPAGKDTSISAIIRQQLAIHKNELRYPASVMRFYKKEGFNLVWLLPDTVKTPVWGAMLLFDCILQYGLNPADYSPLKFTYTRLHAVQTGKVSNAQKAYFDIELTDAVITLINNLHYGKLNPWFSVKKLDIENTSILQADVALVNALKQTRFDIAILNVQPHSEAYTNLQRHMKLLVTKYSGPNSVIPEKDIKKIAINMERLRWINTTGRKIGITCEVRDGVIIYHEDVLHQDAKLEKELYGEK